MVKKHVKLSVHKKFIITALPFLVTMLVLVFPTILATVGGAPARNGGIVLAQMDMESPSGVRLGFTGDPSTSMTVSWWTKSGTTDSKVYYGTSPTVLDKVASSSNVVKVSTGYLHHVQLSGLSPDTRYFYKAGGASGNSTIFNFTTAPAPRSRGVHFVAYGDTRSNIERRIITADMIYSHSSGTFGTGAELVINAGDIVARGDRQDLFDTYSENIEFLAAHVPILYTPGNHEIGPTGSVYPAQFDEPTNGNDGWYYSFNWGPVHFVSIDSEIHDIPIVDAMDLNWLREDLSRARSDNSVLWIVVYFHQPPFVSFSHESRLDIRATWLPILEEFGVDLVLNGHCHAYQRNYPVRHDGTIYKTSDPHYVNPPYPVYIVSGAGAVNSEGTTQEDLRDDDFQARWHDGSLYGPDGDRVFFPGNHFSNFNITIDEATNTTRLYLEVIGLNTSGTPALGNYSVVKVDEMSITKDIPPKWHEPLEPVSYTGYNTSTGLLAYLKLLAVTGIVAVIDVFLVVSWIKARNAARRKLAGQDKVG